MQVLLTGFEDCGNIGSGFKLIYSLGEMLERDFIQSDLEAKHLEVPHRPPAAHAAPPPSSMQLHPPNAPMQLQRPPMPWTPPWTPPIWIPSTR
jgi:hypothetical protein